MQFRQHRIIVFWALCFCVLPQLTFSQKSLEKTIKIGLLISDKNDTHARDAVQLAIDEKNSDLDAGQPAFELVVRHTDGPWGMGSNQTVNLIYKDGVSALITSLDGRTAHLAEQVCAKTNVITLSTRAADASLTEAYVPWFFRIIPNDKQQASHLAEEIVRNNSGHDFFVVSDNTYDSELSFNAFLNEINKKGISSPLSLVLDAFNPDFEALGHNLALPEIKTLVLFTNAELGNQVLSFLNSIDKRVPVYGSIASFTHADTKQLNYPIYTTGFAKTNPKTIANFINSFNNEFGYAPNTIATFAYTASLLLTTAIEEEGNDSNQIRLFLLNNSENYNLPFPAKFDKLGNCTGPFKIKQ